MSVCNGNMYWSNSINLPTSMCRSFVGWNQNYTKIYLISGYNETGFFPQIYEFNGTSFRVVGKFTTDLENWRFSTTVKDIIFFYQGYSDYGIIHAFNTTTLEIQYNISTSQQQKQLNYPDLTCMTSNDTHLFFVVVVHVGQYPSTLLIYNIAKKTWKNSTFITNASVGVVEGNCQYYNHNLYVFGGLWTYCHACGNSSIDPRILVYNDIHNNWTMLSIKLTYDTASASVIMPISNGKIYVIGGNGNGASENNVNLVDVNKMKVSNSSLHKGRTLPMLGFINGKIHVMGGYNNKPINDTEISDFIPTLHPTQAPTMSPVPSHPPTHHPTSSPTESPTNSPTLSPTKPTYSPSTTTSKPPSKAPDVVSLTVPQLIYCVCGMMGLILLCLIGLRCYKRRYTVDNQQIQRDQQQQNNLRENIINESFDGARAVNNDFGEEGNEGAIQANVVDTMRN